MQPVIEEVKLQFKVACSSDAVVLSRLARKTFVETYGDQNTAENMDKYLKSNFSKKSIIEQLDDQKNFFLLVSKKGLLFSRNFA